MLYTCFSFKFCRLAKQKIPETMIVPTWRNCLVVLSDPMLGTGLVVQTIVEFQEPLL